MQRKWKGKDRKEEGRMKRTRVGQMHARDAERRGMKGGGRNQRDKGRNKGRRRGQKAKVTIWACKRWIEFDIGMKGIGLKGMGSVRLHCIQTVESDALIVCREHVLLFHPPRVYTPYRARLKKGIDRKINSEDRTTWERIGSSTKFDWFFLVYEFSRCFLWLIFIFICFIMFIIWDEKILIK